MCVHIAHNYCLINSSNGKREANDLSKLRVNESEYSYYFVPKT